MMSLFILPFFAGFGFATFVTEEGAAKAVAKHFVPVDGKQVNLC